MNNIGGKPNIREQVIETGIRKLSDRELVMLLLRTGSRKNSVESLSKKVISKMRVLSDKHLFDELQKIDGMGIGKTSVICAAIELGRRFSMPTGISIRHPKDIVPLVKHFSLEQQEYFVCVSLSGAHEVIKIRVTSVGTINRTLIHPREVFSDPITDRAAAIILCHNHPSGLVEPSDADIDTTKRLIEASKLLGIKILDHIIITTCEYFSFLENDLIFTEKSESSDYL